MTQLIRKCIGWGLTVQQTCQEVSWHNEFKGRSLIEVTTYYNQFKGK